MNNTSTQQELFPMPQLRRKNGRYCTKEQYRTEKVDNENKVLKYKCEQYYRALLALQKRNASLEREISELKAKIKELI